MEIFSPAGGAIPIDKLSITPDFFNDYCKKFMHDPEAVAKLTHSQKLPADEKGVAEFVEKYELLYCAGGHGTCTDFINAPALKMCIESMFAAPSRYVAAVCHGVIALCDCKKS